MEAELKDLISALEAAGEVDHSGAIQAALASERDIQTIVLSNDIWGGAGSIADQAGFASSSKGARSAIEKALIALGRRQIEEGVVNQRTELWVSAFEKMHA